MQQNVQKMRKRLGAMREEAIHEYIYDKLNVIVSRQVIEDSIRNFLSGWESEALQSMGEAILKMKEDNVKLLQSIRVKDQNYASQLARSRLQLSKERDNAILATKQIHEKERSILKQEIQKVRNQSNEKIVYFQEVIRTVEEMNQVLRKEKEDFQKRFTKEKHKNGCLQEEKQRDLINITRFQAQCARFRSQLIEKQNKYNNNLNGFSSEWLKEKQLFLQELLILKQRIKKYEQKLVEIDAQSKRKQDLMCKENIQRKQIMENNNRLLNLLSNNQQKLAAETRYLQENMRTIKELMQKNERLQNELWKKYTKRQELENLFKVKERQFQQISAKFLQNIQNIERYKIEAQNKKLLNEELINSNSNLSDQIKRLFSLLQESNKQRALLGGEVEKLNELLRQAQESIKINNEINRMHEDEQNKFQKVMQQKKEEYKAQIETINVVFRMREEQLKKQIRSKDLIVQNILLQNQQLRQNIEIQRQKQICYEAYLSEIAMLKRQIQVYQTRSNKQNKITLVQQKQSLLSQMIKAIKYLKNQNKNLKEMIYNFRNEFSNWINTYLVRMISNKILENSKCVFCEHQKDFKAEELPVTHNVVFYKTIPKKGMMKATDLSISFKKDVRSIQQKYEQLYKKNKNFASHISSFTE